MAKVKRSGEQPFVPTAEEWQMISARDQERFTKVLEAANKKKKREEAKAKFEEQQKALTGKKRKKLLKAHRALLKKFGMDDDPDLFDDEVESEKSGSDSEENEASESESDEDCDSPDDADYLPHPTLQNSDVNEEGEVEDKRKKSDDSDSDFVDDSQRKSPRKTKKKPKVSEGHISNDSDGSDKEFEVSGPPAASRKTKTKMKLSKGVVFDDSKCVRGEERSKRRVTDHVRRQKLRESRSTKKRLSANERAKKVVERRQADHDKRSKFFKIIESITERLL